MGKLIEVKAKSAKEILHERAACAVGFEGGAMPKRMQGTKPNDNSMFEFKNPLLSGKSTTDEDTVENRAQNFLKGQGLVELDDAKKTIKGMYDKLVGGKLVTQEVGPALPPEVVIPADKIKPKKHKKDKKKKKKKKSKKKKEVKYHTDESSSSSSSSSSSDSDSSADRKKKKKKKKKKHKKKKD